jgi:hypothetical protein
MNWIKKYAVPFAPTILISFFLIIYLKHIKLVHFLFNTLFYQIYLFLLKYKGVFQLIFISIQDFHLLF